MPKSPFPPGKSSLPEVTDATMAGTLKKHKLAIVSVVMDDCGYCEVLAPHVEKIAKEHATSIGVFTLNIDRNEKAVGELKINAAPTLLFYRAGKLVDRTVGANPAAVQAKLAKLLGKTKAR